jgi:ATP-dependent helicase/nuclease subunit B
MSASRPNVFTIPPGAPFLDILVEALTDGRLIPGFVPGADPLALTDVTIYVPTRRACRALEAAFLARAPHGATVLPRIAPLGDVDEDDEAFSEQGGAFGEDDEPLRDLPPPLSPLQRQLKLSELVASWSARVRATMIEDNPDELPLLPTSPADALFLAAELGRLIDSVETEEVPWDAFSRLVPSDYDEAWRITADFLAIAIATWPEHLAEIGCSDPAWRRSRALRALADDLRRFPPSGPVIAAGSTGSIPATSALLAAIAGLPHGAVVLPGLDLALDEPSWLALDAEDAASFTSPQGGLKRLLGALDIERVDVRSLGEAPSPARARLVSTALRPAATTDLWALDAWTAEERAAALEGVTLVEAGNEREEALTVAALVRATLEVPGRTAAVVTPDRDLARRVAGELARWDIEVEDSAGRPLASTPAGVFARLLAEAAAGHLAPLSLIALLEHDRARFGFDAGDVRRAASALEIGALRGISPAPGASGLRHTLAQSRATPDSYHRYRLWDAAWDDAARLLDVVEAALSPLCDLVEPASLANFASAHLAVLIAAGATPDDPEAGLGGGDGGALRSLLADLAASAHDIILTLGDYPGAITVLLAGAAVRPGRASHARVAILGLLEARLLGADRLILAGLDEGVWPPQARNDPWLSRPMRRTIGLPPPERRIGLAAHDFAQAICHPDVTVTRALKREGVPATPARWLQRLAAVAGPETWNAARERGADWVALARLIDEAPREPVPVAPRPRPPLALRPTRLSVTAIETLFRDPYSIYARHVLDLHPLDPAGLAPGAADRGSLFHDAVAEFVLRGLDPTDPRARDELIAIGDGAFRRLPDAPEVIALWQARFERVADWFLAWERGRRGQVETSFVERKGEMTWTTAAGRRFTLSGRADRFDRLTDGSYAVLDYKTGQLPGVDETRVNFAPQLPLEAAMLEAGAFKDVPPGTASSLVYVRLSGGLPAGEERAVSATKDGRPVAQIAADSLGRLKATINRFEDEAEPYSSLNHPKFRRRPNGPYDHLARVREWSLAGESDGGEE